MSEQKESKGHFIFDGDTKRQHRFVIKSGDGITGLIYIPKDNEGIPERITLDKKQPNKAGQ